MTTITGLTAARMLAIEAASVVGGDIDEDFHLILTKFDASTIDAGFVRGPQGPQGLGPGMIPGEIRLWSGTVLPDSEEYSTWVWANGAAYLIVEHPLAATYIDTEWRTFGGLADPGVDYFRVPDLRGLVPAGLDPMPEGVAAGDRMTHSTVNNIATITGAETHQLTEEEMPSHNHDFISQNLDLVSDGGDEYIFFFRDDPFPRDDLITDTGGDEPHNNVQPTVMIPYIVCLDG